MAMTNLAAVSAALSLVYPRRIVSQINRKTVLPHLLNVRIGSGQGVHGTAKFTGAANAAASAEGVQRSASDADQEIKVGWQLGWSQYDKTASVSDLAKNATAANFNPESAGAPGGDLLQAEVADMATRVMMGFATDIYAGDYTVDPVTNGRKLAGVSLAVDSSSEFAGIDPSDHPEWAAVENTAPLSHLSLQLIEDELITPVYDACSEQPDLLTAPSNIFAKIKQLFDDRVQAVREIQTARGVIKLQAGVQAIEIDGIPVVRDPQATANTLHALNTNYVWLEQLLPPELAQLFGADRPREAVVEYLRMLMDDPKLVIPDADLDGIMARAGSILPCVKVLGPRGLSTEANVYVQAQLHWAKRNAHGKLTFI